MSHYRSSTTTGLTNIGRCHQPACVWGLALLLATGCRDAGPGPDDDIPVNATPFVAAVSAGPAIGQEIVYVSLPSGVIPEGTRAALRVMRRGTVKHVDFIDGGFDPVAVAASVGDSIEVVVERSNSEETVRFVLVVPRPARPVVVRTYPPKNKRDVPLNSVMKVVFSEPIDSATLTAASVKVLRNGVAIAGRLEFPDPSHLSAVFIPLQLLAGNADYELVVTQDIRDLSGASLESTPSVAFTTAAAGATEALSLVFLVQPRITSIHRPWMEMQVGVMDASGRLVETSTAYISMTLLSPTGPVGFDGIVGNSAVDGVAPFWASTHTPGTDYVFEATSPGITGVRSAPFEVTTLPALGSIEIITTSTGSPMPAALTVSLDGAAPVAIGANALRLHEGLEPGNHTIHLSGIGDACMVAGSNPRSINLVAFDTVRVSFPLSCAQVGSIRVATTTTGTDPDPNGYTVEIKRDGFNTAFDVPTSGTVDKATTSFGMHAVTLKGIAENCRVSGGGTRQVDVANGATPAVNFEIACVPVTQLAFVREGQIYLINSNGTGLVQLTNATTGRKDGEPAWSPDGSRIAFVRSDISASYLYVMNADGSNAVLRANSSMEPSWSPDGRRIVFSRVDDGSAGIFTISADDDGTAPALVLNRPGYDDQPAWSPDGRTILYVSDWNFYDGAFDVFAVNVDGSNPGVVLQSLLPGSSNLRIYFNPAWSPDGRRLAVGICAYGWYNCFPSAVLVANADGSGATVLVHTNGGVTPTWSPDGSTLAYYAMACHGCPSSIRYVRGDGSYEDGIVTNGHSPAWRPR